MFLVRLKAKCNFIFGILYLFLQDLNIINCIQNSSVDDGLGSFVQIVAVIEDGFIQRKSLALGFRFEYEDDCEHMRDVQQDTIGPNSLSPHTRPLAAQLGLSLSPRW